ncbi:MAG: 4-(cytidine 5'-diphospho)-2-C-methyl-D-erythritol kinase [Cytophagales bacterium]|nr:4-(cytidine 5'-diphospho)-2-C-methyl-D-erythritol kinase [Cytophagales bacterium]
MISFPNAKINLGLNVTNKRQDGYHEIQSCLFPIPLRDILEIIPADTFSFKQTGLEIPDNGANNLCVQAYELLKSAHDLPPVAIHLHKVIPMGAGLGGGSADCAFTLKLLNDIFTLGLNSGELEGYAAQLGSDCPFFIKNIPALATGTGTTLAPFHVDLSAFHIALIFPGVHIGTKEAYAGLTPKQPDNILEATIGGNIKHWQQQLVNDFQPAAANNHENIRKALETMGQADAIYYAMTGSGSTVYGLFDHLPDSATFDFTGSLDDL